MGGWLDQLRLKLTQSPTGVGVEVGTELGNFLEISQNFVRKSLNFYSKLFETVLAYNSDL